MKPADKGGADGGPTPQGTGKPKPQNSGASDPTDPVGRPLSAAELEEPSPWDRTMNAIDLPKGLALPKEVALDASLEAPFEPTLNIVEDLDIVDVIAGEAEPTRNVSPDVGLVNDPRRVVLPPAGEADETRQVMPRQLAPPAPLPPSAPHVPAAWEPTVNVSPDPAMVNDPNRVFAARQEAQGAPTVNVVPDLAVVNDPNRIFVARAEAQAAPTVNVVPDRALQNQPGRLLWVRTEAPEPPTATGVPPQPLVVPPTPGSGLLWVRDEPETAPTVNQVPGGSSQVTDPNSASSRPESTVRTDPDATAGSNKDVPWAPEAGESTVQLDLPAEAKVLTQALQALKDRKSGPKAVVPLGEESKNAMVPRPSPAKAPKLDGVAPLVPIQHFPNINPAIDVTARTDPPTQYGAGPAPGVPISILANFEAYAPPNKGEQARPPVEAWRDSPEVQQWTPEAVDNTRVMSRVEKEGQGLRPPNVRDALAIGLGFVLVVIAMVVIRRGPSDGSGPAAAAKIKPPAGYVAPAPVKESIPYVSPDVRSAESRYTMAGASSGGSSSGGASASAAAQQSAASTGLTLPPTRLPVPKCNINVPGSLDTKVRWVMEGKKKLLELKATPSRLAIQRANLFVASASNPELAKIERTENAAVFFVVYLEPEPKGEVAKVVLDCECGIANAAVLATINKKELTVELKYTKVTPPEVIAAKARKKR